MIRLKEPSFSFESTLMICATGIPGNSDLYARLLNCKSDLLNAATHYVQAANAGQLYKIEPIDTSEDGNSIVIGELRKSDLVKIYDQYFVPTDKPARKVYDALLNAAQESCPFCGGIGVPRNLDHFLPKAHYPQFSVLPKNLVPSCRDCNMDGKGQTYASTSEDQIIQPYVDNERFFSTQWIFARYYSAKNDQPGWIEYYVDAPFEWDDGDKAKVHNHFKDFDLAKRYGIRAGQQLTTILSQIKRLQDEGLGDQIISTLLIPGIEQALFINHWQRGMYQALMQSMG